MSVGKTSIKRTFMGLTIDSNYAATIGADFSIKEHVYSADNEDFNLRYLIYDLAGQPRYDAIRGLYMVGTNAAIFVYDIANRESYDNVEGWIREFKKVIKEDIPIVIVGNKVDLRETGDNNSTASEPNEVSTELDNTQGKTTPSQGTISTEEGKKLVEKLTEIFNLQNNIYFIETSAKTNENIERAFDLISKRMYEDYIKDSPFNT